MKRRNCRFRSDDGMHSFCCQLDMYGSHVLLRTNYTHHYACMQPHPHTHTLTHGSHMLMLGLVGKLRTQQAGKEKMWEKVEAPRFCVPLRLYRLVSLVHDRRLCLFQKLQTQSPESGAVATGGGRKDTQREKRREREVRRQEKVSSSGGGGGGVEL